MNIYSKSEKHIPKNQETYTISNVITYCVTFLDNLFAKAKELPKEILIKLNILNLTFTIIFSSL